MESGAEIDGRWRHLAEVTRPFNRPALVCYLCSVDISHPILTVFKLLALSHFGRMDWKRKSAVGGTTQWKIVSLFVRPI
jgi:hypothetical protein